MEHGCARRARSPVKRTKSYVPDRGDLVWITQAPQAGHEQAGRRPALVLSPASYNGKVGLALVCPVTSQVKGYPFEVPLPEGLPVSGGGSRGSGEEPGLESSASRGDWQGARGDRNWRPVAIADVTCIQSLDIATIPIASTGHTTAHAPHETQSIGRMSHTDFHNSRQWVGHTATQSPQRMHFDSSKTGSSSVFIRAVCKVNDIIFCRDFADHSRDRRGH